MTEEPTGFAVAVERLENPYYDSILPEEVAKAAANVIPGFYTQGEKAPKYREHVLMEYMENPNIPPRRAGNGEGRTAKENRLDHAWDEVNSRMERSENTIRNCVLGVYEGPGEYMDKPSRLRSDFDKILEQAGRSSE